MSANDKKMLKLFIINKLMRKSNNEKSLPTQGNTIDRQFYYNLLSLEKAIIKEPQLDAVQ